MENKTCEWAAHPSNRQDPVCEEPATRCIWYRPGELGEQRFYICEKHYKGVFKGGPIIPANKICEWATSPFNHQNLVCEEPATKCICFRRGQHWLDKDGGHEFYICEKHYKEFWEGPIVVGGASRRLVPDRPTVEGERTQHCACDSHRADIG